ncbi:Phosphoenolpyruvate/pyruvate domain-containing protein [Auricularia subglabra TFB-10046 SS5]|nr:Phosphoenolpyruvate/pyruvate domain-containing protein [Auricularia subglabra TFB-10046 SS5]
MPLQIAHPLLNAFRASKPAFGAWLTLPNPSLARAVALAHPAISWVCLDGEHGLFGLGGPAVHDTLSVLAALPGGGPTAYIRIPATAETDSVGWQIKLALDSGARGVLVPMCPDAAAAKRVAQAARFPPTGIRGLGSPVAHTLWGAGATMKQYLDGANESVLVMVQIETVQGMQNVDSIAAVDGIDVLFIGPFDLSIAHGYQPPSPDPVPEVEKLIQEIKEAAHKHGKKCAIYCTSGEQGAKRAEQGFDIISVTNDLGALTDGLVRTFSAASGETPEGAKVRY